MNPAVSILIPVYNREELVGRAIDSALAQTLPNVEIVVVDNASTDGTWGVIEGYQQKSERICSWRNGYNLGPVWNWYRCVGLARAPLSKFVFSDDWIEPTFLEKTVPLLTPWTAFVYSKTIVHFPAFDVLSHANGETGHYPLSDFIEGHRTSATNYPASPGCALFRTKDLRRNLVTHSAEGVDFTEYGAGTDLLFFLGCANRYKEFGYVDEPLAHFDAHSDSITMRNPVASHYGAARTHFYGEERVRA